MVNQQTAGKSEVNKKDVCTHEAMRKPLFIGEKNAG
jgi:hypothetical protein